MRWLAPLFLTLLLVGIHAAERSTMAEPLPTHGAMVATVTAALMAVSRGDTAALAALPATAFRTPVALANERTPDVSRRWTLALPEACARLDDAARAQVATVLDRRYALAVADGADATAVALDHLPSPSALRALTAAGDMAFDYGRFETFLACAAFVPLAESDQRRALARALLARSAAPDATVALTEFGLPELLPQPAPVAVHAGEEAGLAVRWQTRPGWVLACDPWDRVLWQYAVELGAQTHAGAGATVVRDRAGLRAIDESGSVTALPPLPDDIALVAVAGGAAWFLRTGFMGDAVGWRLGLDDQRVSAFAFTEAPIAPPLVRGARSLWLTMRGLLLYDGERLVQRLEHGLDVDADWRLASAHTPDAAVLLLTPDGRAWRLPPFAVQFAAGTAVARGELLVASGRWNEALTLLENDASDAAKSVRLHAYLGMGPETVNELGVQVLGCVTTAAERALVWQAMCMVPGNHDDNGFFDDLSPLLTVPMDADDLLRPAARWRHTVSVAALHASWPLDHRAEIAPPLAAPVLTRTTDAPPLPTPQRAADGSITVLDQRFTLSFGPTWTQIEATDRHGALRWRHRWAAPPPLSAPSRNLAYTGGFLVVAAGASHLDVLDPTLGRVLARHALRDTDAQPAQVRVLDAAATHIAVLWPIGVNDRVTFHDAGIERTVPLPAPAQWAVPIPGQNALLVRLADGRAMRVAGADNKALQLVTLPPELNSPVDAWTLAGVWRDHSYFAWR